MLAWEQPIFHFTNRRPAASAPAGMKGFGQGKAATTILADQGDSVHVISDVPYTVRSRHHPCLNAGRRRGVRPMHMTTLTMPHQNHSHYVTTNKTVFSGSRTLDPAEVPHPYPSQHVSQITLNHKGESLHPWDSHYETSFHDKGVTPSSTLHRPTFDNKMNMNEGRDVKQVLVNRSAQPNYFTQYSRIHNTLGTLLGPGVSREPPVRRQYDVLTGEVTGPAWNPENKRVSGGRLMYNTYRRDTENRLVLN